MAKTVIAIVHVEDRGEYQITHVLLDDGTEASGYGADFKMGDKVGVFFDERYNKIKVKKVKTQTPQSPQ